MGAKIAIGWTRALSAKKVKASELVTVLENQGPVTIPDYDHNDRIALWYSNELGDFADVHLVGGANSELNMFGSPQPLVKNGVSGQVRLTVARRVADLLSGEQYVLQFTGA